MSNNRRTTKTVRVDGFIPLRDRAEYMRGYRQTTKYKAYHREYIKKWREKNVEKTNAHQLVSNAIQGGRLVKPATCPECNRPELLEAHHPDYSKPLEVLWLCIDCHKALHRKLKLGATNVE